MARIRTRRKARTQPSTLQLGGNIACTAQQLLEHLKSVIKRDPSAANLPVYSNSPMDAEYAFPLGHQRGAYVGEVYETESDTFVEKTEDAKVVRALVIDTH